MQAVQVPVDLLHWVLAILPIVALLVFLVPLRWRAPEAGPMAMFTAAIVALRPIHLPRAQCFAHSIRDWKPARSRRHHRKLWNDGAEIGVRAQHPAQPHTQDLRGFVVAHGERDLHEFVGVQAVWIFEMAIAQAARAAQ